MKPDKYPWNHQKRYNTFAEYQRAAYGKRVQKVTVDAGFTCPNRDGTLSTGGCIYCNNISFNPSYNSARKSITQQIEEGIEFLKRRYKNIYRFIVYFQPYSNTYAPLDVLKRLYEEALSHEEVIGLTIGSRPDCVDEEKLDYLASLAQNFDITIEYGLESISDETLIRINRGHDVQSYILAMEASKMRGIKTCTHLIFGFPWENKELWYKTAGWISEQAPDFLKVHQLHVVKQTALAKEYEKKPFELLGIDESLEMITEFLERLSPHIVIQRLFSEAPPKTLTAPHWGIRNDQLLIMLDELLEKKNTWQGRLYNP